MRVWTGKFLHFGSETKNRAESEHSILKAWIVTRHDDLDTKYNDKSNPVIAQLCYNISHLASCVELPRIFYIAHAKTKKSSESGSGSGSESGSGTSSRERGRLPQAFYNFIYPCIADWKNEKGDGNCGFRVLSYLLYEDENQWPKVRRQIWNEMHETGYDGFAPRWIDVPDHLIFVTNTFNSCIVLIVKQDSCTVFPFYSSPEQVGDTVGIRHLADSEHFIAISFFHLNMSSFFL
ncbi:hypothetical protein M9H77_36484 [Catharanthus roseus]|uniref:Uncharacterized protein n=1 Tax=Catharanthus roseus TaxID=4058 RepID=A0ACB9ZRY8_CATRO|nr:hypothetical protein M9H77_36484 [Catharanthus roseus]